MRRGPAWLTTQAYAPICAQVTTLGVFAGPPNDNEDCLYLNVFTPNLDPSARLPVIVWIHGGGNVDGEAPGYDGSKLAADGKTVVVTLQYRLNLMGWFAHPALDDEGHYFGNYGILDQQAVLKWVQRNIATFGGDKNNVTLGGQSAGARDTQVNMMSPLANGLFQRAICESWCSFFPMATAATAEAKGVAFSVAAGCGSGTGSATAKCLRGLTSAQVEALAGTESAQSQYIAGLMVDGNIITMQPQAAFTSGQYIHVPVMNGDTEDEANFFLAITEYFSGPPRVPPTAAQYINYVNTTYATPPYPAGTAAKVSGQLPAQRLCESAIGLEPGGDGSNHLLAKDAGQNLRDQRSHYTRMSSTTRRRRPTFLKCPGFSNSPTTPPTSNICSPAGTADQLRRA